MRTMLLPLLLALAAVPAGGAVTAADIARSVRLRADWIGLTRDVADAAGWTADGRAIVYRKTVAGGFAFMSYDPATGTKTPAFDQARLAAGLGRATGARYDALRLPFERVAFAENGRVIDVAAEDAQWRCSLADYACRARPRLRQPRGFGVVRDLAVPADNRPRRSPDGKWEARVENHNLAIRAAGTDAWTRISTDGSAGDFYDPESISWSPDSAKIAAYRVRPGYRRIVTKVRSSPTNQKQPEVTEQLYPKPGDAVDIDRPTLFHVATRRQLPIPAALFDNPYDMTRLEWRADSRSFTFTYEGRGHQVARVIAVDADTGVPHAAVTETARTFINQGRRFRHDLDNGRTVIWMSERDGWNHLYLFDGATGRVRRQITRGPWVVRDVLRVDEARRQIVFSAGGREPGDPYLQQVYRIDFDGTHLTRLTAADAYHDVALSPDGLRYVDTYSRIDMAPVAELHRTSDGALLATIERADVAALTAAGYRPPEPFVAKGRDGTTDIYGVIVRPRDFDPAKRYPVIENIYSGPHASFVPKTWWPFGYHSGGDKQIGMQALADLGFVVVQIDGMGTLNRSKAFHDVAWKNRKDAGFPDRILWHRAAAARFPWYDIGRVGIYGASTGGEDTLNALLFHPDFYKVGVAYAGCYDNRMDKISWTEQWMGWPVDASYAESSGVDNAWRLQGRLLMIVGELDDNVDPASTFQVADALIRANKTFDLLVVPGEGHAVGRSTGPVDYVQRKQFDFFVQNLGGEPVPNWNAAPAAP